LTARKNYAFAHLRGCLRSTTFVVVTILTASAQGQVEEFQAKSAYLFNFAKFVEWPQQAFKTTNSPIRICVLGRDLFVKALDETVSGKAVQGRPFVVHQLSNPPSVIACHILFVDASERKRFLTLVEELRVASVLTVGEAPGFISDGGVINLKTVNGRIAVEINVTAAERVNLRISSRLLSIARIVRVNP